MPSKHHRCNFGEFFIRCFGKTEGGREGPFPTTPRFVTVLPFSTPLGGVGSSWVGWGPFRAYLVSRATCHMHAWVISVSNGQPFRQSCLNRNQPVLPTHPNNRRVASRRTTLHCVAVVCLAFFDTLPCCVRCAPPLAPYYPYLAHPEKQIILVCLSWVVRHQARNA